MPFNIKNFDMHRAVVQHQSIDEGNWEGAQRYIDTVSTRIINELSDDPQAQEELEGLKGYFIALRACAELARDNDQELKEYFETLIED